MNEIDVERRLTSLENRLKSNTHRIDDLERQSEALTKLASAVEVLAAKQSTMSHTLDRLDSKVETLEALPARRWETAVASLITGVVGFILALVLRT